MATIDTSGTVLLQQNGADVQYSLDNSANWIDISSNLWPVTLANADTSSPLEVRFVSDLSFNSSTQYFIMGSENITIDGSNNVVNINSISNYLGLFQNGTGGPTSYSDITVKNLGVISNSSTLNNGGGWVCQTLFGENVTNNIVENCYSTGAINQDCGGICGQNSSSSVSNCYSIGTIGNRAGGIFGYDSTGSATNCYSTGTINSDAGGIFGYNTTSSQASNCYSIGPIGDNAGGIFGRNSSGSAINCYSIGDIGLAAGGIFGQLSQSGASATNCYSTGTINNSAGGIFGENSPGSATNCYSTGNIGINAGGIFGTVSSGSAINCYSTGEISGNQAGGIFAGSSSGSATNCYSTGTISGSSATGIGVIDASYCYVTDGSANWLDASANAALDFSGNPWTDIDTTSTKVPYLLTSFLNQQTLYAPSSGTDVVTKTAAVSTHSDYTWSITSVNGSTSGNPEISIDASGIITFGSLQNDVYQVNVLAVDSFGEYSFEIFTDNVTTIDASGSVLVKQDVGSDVQYSLDSGTNWTNAVWPITLNNTNTPNTLTVTFISDLSLNSTDQYFIMGSENITIDGSNNTVNVNVSTNDYPGLVQNGTVDASGNSYITIQNLAVESTYTVAQDGGWVGQQYFGNGINNIVTNCYSTGDIGSRSGGIFGSYSQASATNCYSTGTINSDAGGIFGYSSQGSASNCYSTGSIGNRAGGIFGQNSSGSAFNCYSIGLTFGSGQGIGGSDPSYCYFTDGSTNWLDSNANASLNPLSAWTDIDLNSDTVPYLLSSFLNQQILYDPSSGTNVVTKTAAVSTPTDYTWSITSVNGSTSGNQEISIDASGVITFGSLQNGTYEVNVLAVDSFGEYSFEIFTDNVTTIDASGSVLVKQDVGSDVQYSLDSSTNWTNVVWPFTLNNTNTPNTLTVTFITDLSLNSIDQYFIMGSDNITIYGSDNTVNVNVTSYPGLVQNGRVDASGNSYISIQNLAVESTYTVEQEGGWVGQQYFGRNATENYVENCYSSGTIGLGAGGIFGSYSEGSISNCYSTGNIGDTAGGIFGQQCSSQAEATNCYSTGSIGNDAGGIFGQSSQGSATNCYSTGIIGFGGGIFGPVSSGSATNCYSTGAIDPSGGQGIGVIDASYCYYTDGSANWLDTSANAALNISGTVWTDIDLSSLTVPYLLSAFTTTLYDPSSVSNDITISATTTNTRLIGYNNWSIYSICNNDPPSEFPGISINSNSGELDCSASLINGVYTINVLAQNSSGGYYFGNVVNTISGRAEPSYDTGTTNPPTDAVVNNVTGDATVATNNTGVVVQSVTSADATVAVGTGGSVTVYEASGGILSTNSGASLVLKSGRPTQLSGAGTFTLGVSAEDIVTLDTSNDALTGTTNIAANVIMTNQAALGSSTTNLTSGSRLEVNLSQSGDIGNPINASSGSSILTNTGENPVILSGAVSVDGSLSMDGDGAPISVTGPLSGGGVINTSGTTSFSDITGLTGGLNTTDNSDTTVGSSAPNASVSQGANSTTRFGIASSIAAKTLSVKSSANNLTYDSYTLASGATIDITNNGINVTNDFTVDGSATIIDPGFANSIDVSGSLIINNDSVLTITLNSDSLTEGTFTVFTFSDLSGGSAANFEIDVTSSQYQVSGELGTNSYIVTVIAIAPCFLAGTPIVTNQGLIHIDKLDPSVHTIRNKKIVAISKTISPDKYLVQFEKNALGKNMPSERTLISQNHIIFYKGKQIKAKDFVNDFEDVKKVPYKGEVLYNVLLEEHDKMMVNNLICETLHPKNIVAQIFRQLPNLTAEQAGEIVLKLNKQFLKNKQGDSKVVIRI
jgi:hypothetical protein